jgi:hypothetical protein
MPKLTRRDFLLTAVAAGTLAASPAFAQFAQRTPFPQGFSSFAVDVGPLKQKGLGGFADLVAAAMQQELRRQFADRVDSRGPRLVVQVNQISMTPFPDGGGGDDWWGGRGGGSDSINGIAYAIGRRGEILAQHPQLAVLDVRRSILDPDEQGRAVRIAQHYAQWLRREI